MNALLTSMLILHIASGFTALGFGLIAILSKPGQRAHLLTGRVFYFSMLLIAFSAVVLSSFKLNLFLLLIAFFALYNNVSGYRSIKNKSLRPTALDWAITIVGLVTGIIMISTMNVVLLVFGGLSLSLAIGDIVASVRILKGKEAPRFAWLIKHIGMMMGAYIATFTAFVVVNIDFVQPCLDPMARSNGTGRSNAHFLAAKIRQRTGCEQKVMRISYYQITVNASAAS